MVSCLHELRQCAFWSSPFLKSFDHKLNTYMVSSPHELMLCGESSAPFVNICNHKWNTWMVYDHHALITCGYSSTPFWRICDHKSYRTVCSVLWMKGGCSYVHSRTMVCGWPKEKGEALCIINVIVMPFQPMIDVFQRQKTGLELRARELSYLHSFKKTCAAAGA